MTSALEAQFDEAMPEIFAGLTVERLVLEPKWRPLFSIAERKRAVDQLRKCDFDGPLPEGCEE